MPTSDPLDRQLNLFSPGRQPADAQEVTETQEPPPGAAANEFVDDAQAVDQSAGPSVGKRRIALRQHLADLLDAPVASLKLTKNRRRMLSAKPTPLGLAVRLHRCFLDAPDAEIHAVAVLLDAKVTGRRRKKALAVARGHFAQHAAEHMKPPRKIYLNPRGRVYDLVELRDRVETEYFDGDLQVHITWGQNGYGNADLRRGGIHIRLGSYDSTHRLVRIHPVLDREEVPEYVVESVVHHEMLHAAEPPKPGRLRRSVHHRSFRQREREFRRYDEAERWIEKNLKRLARWRRHLI